MQHCWSLIKIGLSALSNKNQGIVRPDKCHYLTSIFVYEHVTELF